MFRCELYLVQSVHARKLQGRWKEVVAKRQKEFLRSAKKKQVIHRGDAFDEAFFHYLKGPLADQAHETLNEKRFTLKKSDVSTRVANHWESEGVVEDPRPDGKGWRRFSVLDLVWLQAVARLRSFGLPIDKLRRMQKRLQDLGDGSTEAGNRISFFEFYVVRAMMRAPVYLLAFEDGGVELATEREYENAFTKMTGLADHVRISLNPIVQDFFPDKDLSPQHDPAVRLTDDEVEFFFLLRTGDYDAIKVKRKGGRIEIIEAEETVTEERIVDIMNEEDFQDIEIKRQNGKTVSVKRTIKKKPKS